MDVLQNLYHEFRYKYSVSSTFFSAFIFLTEKDPQQLVIKVCVEGRQSETATNQLFGEPREPILNVKSQLMQPNKE